MGQEERAVLDQLALQQECKQAGQLLGAAGFTEVTMKPGFRGALRCRNGYHDFVLLDCETGHCEAVRQCAELPLLWLPGLDNGDDYEWVKKGSPMEVVQELLAQDES